MDEREAAVSTNAPAHTNFGRAGGELAAIHPSQIPDLVARVQQLELESQHKNEIISDLRDREATLQLRLADKCIVIAPSDLACKDDITRRAGWPRGRVDWLRETDSRFPRPITRLGTNEGIPVWDYREVQAYIDKYIDKRRTA